MFSPTIGTVGTGASGPRGLRHGLLSTRSLGSSARRPWPARHGSGATGSDPMDIGPPRRAQRTPSPGRRTHQFAPGGPVTATEWTDQIEWLQRQLTTLAKSVADHAHVLGQLQTVTLPAANEKIDTLAGSADQRFVMIDKRLTDGGNAVNRRLEVLSAEIRSLAANHHGQARAPSPMAGTLDGQARAPSPPPAVAGTQHFDVQTPQRGRCPDPRYLAPELGPFHMGGQPSVHMGQQPPTAQHGGDFGVRSTPSIGSPPPVNTSVNRNMGGNYAGPSNVGHGIGAGYSQPTGVFGPPNGGHGGAADYQQCAGGAVHTNFVSHQSYLPKWSHPVTTPLWNSFPNGEWKIGKKGIGELPIFDGDHSKYSHWKNKLGDYCADTNPYWKLILKHAQEHPTVLDYDTLASMRYGQFNGWDLSLDLWNFLSKRLGIGLYEKRVQLAGNMDGNGFELWRSLYNEYEGRDEFVKLGGRTDLQNFEKITNTVGITQKLADWQHAMLLHGGDIGIVTRRTMLLRILPENLRNDVLKQKMYDPDAIIAWIKESQTWNRSEEIMKKRRGSVSAITQPSDSQTADGQPSTSAPTAPSITEIVAAVVAAVGDKRGNKGGGKGGNRSRSQSPAARARESFPKDTCYHCKEKGHSRTAGKLGKNKPCPAFAKLLADNGNKLPAGYKGAFEKHVEAFKAKDKGGGSKNIAAITDHEVMQLLNEDSDSSDDSDFGLPCGAVWQLVGPKCSNPFAPNNHFPTVAETPNAPKKFNAFKVLQEADPENPCFDDALSPEASDQLKTWAHKVSRKSDRQSKSWELKSDEDVEKLKNLLCGTNHKKSESALRKLQESTDIDDLASLIERKSSTPNSVGRRARRVWAMVDSGSFVTKANCAKSFPGHTVRPSIGSRNGVAYSNASGGDIPNRGEIVVTHQLDDNSELDIPFQDGDVQVPIISVKDFVRKNSIVKFKRNGGTIKLPSGTILK